MMRALLLCSAALLASVSQAQFGPMQFAFESDVAYPRYLWSGDVDGDGDVDPIVLSQPGGSSYSWPLLWFPNLGGGQFGPGQVMLLGPHNSPDVRMRDMDADGDVDLVEGDTWYVNDGTGSLTLVGNYVPSGAAAHLLEDLDGDGDVDDVIRNGNGLNLLLNDGSGVFTVGPAFGPAGATTTLFASRADLNGDGLPDLMIGGDNAQMGWYPNLGGGSFGAQQVIANFVAPAKPYCGDVDGDGDNDIIGFGLPGGTIWFANDGFGTFSVGDTIPATEPRAIADWDGDGDVDFSRATGTSCNVHVLQNQSGLSWSTLVVENVSGYNLANTGYASGDLNGDGLTDLLVCNGMDIAGWYPNLGNGSIGERKRFCQTMAGAYDISAADIDLDGDQDLVTASYYGDWVCWYPNNGDGTFDRQRVVVENRDKVGASRTADLDADGLPDIITDRSSCAVIWNNNGGSSWTPDTLPGLGVSRWEVDLDGDLDLDLLGSDQWFENDGSGNFTVHTEPLLTAGIVRTGDMNNDGHADVVIGTTTTWTILLNNGSGTFSSSSGSANLYLFDLADMDNDGDLDVLGMANGVLISGYMNDGNGNLSAGQLLFTGDSGLPRTIMANDINGDGFPDAVWAYSNGYTHKTFHNLNLGDGSLGPASLIDPTAESAAAMILTDLNSDAVPDLVTARFRSLGWQENYFYEAFRLRGSVFLDFDLNAMLDSTDRKVAYRLVRTDANDVLVWTNSAGDYDLPADTGTWHAWHTPSSLYQVTNNPDTLEATLTVLDPIATDLDIGLAPAIADTLPFVTTTTSGGFRCNTSTGIWIHLRNNGTFIPEDIMVDLFVHPDLTIVGAWPAPDSIVAGHVYWHVDSLGWFQEFSGLISAEAGPVGTSAGYGYIVDAANLGIVFDAPLYPFPVSCAFDPNDKLVTPQGYGPAGAVPIDTEWLEYTIRFQNTGNDTAFTVQLLDTLDSDLDVASMEVLAASHALTQIQVDADHVALFRFQQILLPDSIVNEPASHGFVKYRIRPLSGSPHGTEITNSAGIYFDLNEPVITNTVLNTLVDCALHEATITVVQANELEASSGDAYQWYLNGDSIVGATSSELTLQLSGDYTVGVTSSYGCVDLSGPYTFISTGITIGMNPGISIAPNPASAFATLVMTIPLDELHVIRLLDMGGRTLRTWRGNGSNNLRIERGDLSSGPYMVQVDGPIVKGAILLTFTP